MACFEAIKDFLNNFIANYSKTNTIIMKKILFLAVAFVVVIGCNNTTETPNTEEDTTTLIPQSMEVETDEPTEINPLGSYVGMFLAEEYKANKKPSYANKINITIDSMTTDKVYGHSIVAGNMRPFEGTLAAEGDTYTIAAKEPGDDRYDGTFDFKIENGKIVGTWIAYDKNLAVTKRSYNLDKRKFQYNPNLALPEDVAWGEELYGTYDEKLDRGEFVTYDVLKFNASTTELKKEDIENMYQADLEVIRNSIYARHGYSFKNRRMRYLFDTYVEWYVPLKTNILADLTDLEKKNIELLKRYEDHAEKYYDTFGR